MWLGKLTALDMIPLGWLGRKTSTQTNKPRSGQLQQTTNWLYFSDFSYKIGSDTSCKLSPLETICMKWKETVCMKCQILFSRINKKIFQNVICWNFYPACKVFLMGLFSVSFQLIISIQFNQAIKLHSLKLQAPVDKGPKTVKVFQNLPQTLDFDSADSNAPVQTLE